MWWCGGFEADGFEEGVVDVVGRGVVELPGVVVDPAEHDSAFAFGEKVVTLGQEMFE